MTRFDASTLEVTRDPDGVPGVIRYRRVTDSGPVPGPSAVILAVMHGNEPAGLRVLEQLHQAVSAELVGGTLWAIRANIEAAALDQRHTPGGKDLNRQWDPDTLARIAATPREDLCYEERRALELAPMVLSADALLDLHSTSRPSAPFVVFRDDQRHAALARALGVAHLVTGMHENGILSGGAASNAGLRAGERSSRLGVAFEAGQHSDPENGIRAWHVATRFLHFLGMWRSAPPPPEAEPGVFECTERFLQARAGRPPWRFVGYEGGEAGEGRRGPLRHLHSFEEVHADEVVVRRGTHGVVRAHHPFTMLMPAPTTAPGTDLYYVTQPRHGGLTQGEFRTDEAARQEALAIERMLDLLADDDFVTGTSWVAFDSRRLFDVCASIVGRNIRLPAGHPHRRLTVLGRGDTPSDDANERRDTWRYRAAMQVALRDGVPIERFQLLRGAALGWIDALTSASMASHLAARAEVAGAPPVQLRVSLRQPHTASWLVAGDLDLAIRTGDTRYVRVALLVEAATVEPDGASVRVRVLRTGLVSARQEVLLAAHALLSKRRDEHAYEVARGALRHAATAHRLLDASGAFALTAESNDLAGLRSDMREVQRSLWVDQLRSEVTEPIRLDDDDAVGRWLSHVMARTGILDAQAVLSLVTTTAGAARVVDPSRLDVGEPARLEPPVHPRPSTTSRQPVFARDITADDLERWVGWKRFVRGVRSVPDNRGKDFDLAFSELEVHRRLERWYRDALAVADAGGDEILVVLAGDGMNPRRDADNATLQALHDRLLLHPGVHYLRLQNARGTHLRWLRAFAESTQQRPVDARPFSVHWELEHGDTVSVVLVARRARGRVVDEWTLEGWDIERCGVIVSSLPEASGYGLAWFTEPSVYDRGVNHELIAFGRAHCQRLLEQSTWSVASLRGPPSWSEIRRCMLQPLARWVSRVRGWRARSATMPDAKAEQVEWVSRRMGIEDAELVRLLVDEMGAEDDPWEGARRVWEAVG